MFFVSCPGDDYLFFKSCRPESDQHDFASHPGKSEGSPVKRRADKISAAGFIFRRPKQATERIETKSKQVKPCIDFSR